jgi:hypothetical protein
MARCCWAKRGTFGLQTENLQGEREAHPNDLRRLLATVCDRGCDITCDSRNILRVGHNSALRAHEGNRLSVSMRAYRGNPKGNDAMR